MTGLALGIAGLALTVAGVSLGLTIYQLRGQRDRDTRDFPVATAATASSQITRPDSNEKGERS
jgi:hypothetical protein